MMWADYQPTLRKWSRDRRRADRKSKNASIQQSQESRLRPTTTFEAKVKVKVNVDLHSALS